MVNHTQTTRRHKPADCLSVFDHFVRLAYKGLIPKCVSCKKTSLCLNVLLCNSINLILLLDEKHLHMQTYPKTPKRNKNISK